MPRATPANLKNKNSRKIIEDSDRESSIYQSDSERSSYEDDECNSSSESEVEEAPQKEKVKKEKPKAATSKVVKNKPQVASKVLEKKQSCKDKKPSSSSPAKRRKKDYDLFDDSDVKIDMSNENIKSQKIKLTSNLLIECRTIVVDEPDKKKFSYPGIVFIRKMKDDKCFEFNIPLAIASRVVNAIEIMTNDKNKRMKE
jgi:hypothetical protein